MTNKFGDQVDIPDKDVQTALNSGYSKVDKTSLQGTLPAQSSTPVVKSSQPERTLPSSPTGSIAAFKSVLQSVARIGYNQPTVSSVVDRYKEQGINLTDPNAISTAVGTEGARTGKSVGEIYKSTMDLINEEEKRKQDYISTVMQGLPKTFLAQMSGKDYDELKSGNVGIDLKTRIAAAAAQEKRTDNKFQFVSQTENQPGGVFDPMGGTFTPTTPTPAPGSDQGSVSYRTNNPGNIKWTGASWQTALGGVDSGIKATDGGTFVKFPTLDAGTKAQTQLLTSSSYANLTLDAAMKRWSNNGYGADVAPKIDPNKKMSKLTQPELDYLAGEMKVREGFKAPTTGFDQFSQEQVALAVLPPTLRNSDTEKKQLLAGIRKGLAEGKSPYEVADILMGYKIDKPDAFSDSMRKYISLADLNGGDISEMARLINNGNKAEAIAKVENAIMNKAKTSDPDGYMGEATVKTATTRANLITKSLNQLGSNSPVGVVKGTMEQWLGRLKGKDAQAIATEVTTLVAEMRNRLSGTAVTKSEESFLADIIPKLGDSPENFMIKLNNLKTQPLTQLNSVRSTFELPALTEQTLLDRSLRIPMYQSQLGGSSEQSNQQNQKPPLSSFVNPLSSFIR